MAGRATAVIKHPLLWTVAVVVVGTAAATDCVLAPWSPWSPCTEACDCGLRERYRETKTQPTADGKKCAHDAEASTCNCDKCEKVKAARPKKHIALPASTAHGFTPASYKPSGGFPTDVGEQAACVLDKAEAVVDIVPAMLNCHEWHHTVGEACYALPIEHLIKHTEACCEGREHFVLWKSDLDCEKNIAPFVNHLKKWASPLFDACTLKGDASACTKLRTKDTYNHFATLLEQGITAAKALYAKGKPGDLTETAKAFTEVCVPQASNDSVWNDIMTSMTFPGNPDQQPPKTVGSPATAVACLSKIKAFADKYDPDQVIKRDDARRRLLRGASA